MNRYTVQSNPVVDRYVDGHIQKITEAILDIMKSDTRSIVLSGGFGRGEGSVLVDADDNCHVINDYDIDVVYDDSRGKFISKLLTHLKYEKRLNRLAEDLATELEIKQIDICLRGESTFQIESTPKLADYDLKKGHIILHGEKDPTTGIGEFNSNEIPAFEGAWLLRNRGIGLLLASFYLDDKTLASDKKEYFYIEINKAIMAMGDALLILTGNYNSSYEWRMNNISSHIPADCPDREPLINLYKKSVSYKLIPQIEMHEESSPYAIWLEVSKLYESIFLYHESRRLSTKISNISQYCDLMSANSATAGNRNLKLIYDVLRGNVLFKDINLSHLKYDRSKSIALTALLISNSHKSSFSSEDIDSVTNTTNLRRINFERAEAWRQLTRSFLYLIHPKGELGRVLG